MRPRSTDKAAVGVRRSRRTSRCKVMSRRSTASVLAAWRSASVCNKRGQPIRRQETLLEIAEDHCRRGWRRRDMPSLADALTLLLASGAAVVRVGFSAADSSSAGHAGTAGAAHANASEKGRAVDDARPAWSSDCSVRVLPGRVGRPPSRSEPEPDFDDGRRIVLAAAASVALAIGRRPVA